MSTLQALILGLLQGSTELFPVSSLGHAVVVPALFGWDCPANSPGNAQNCVDQGAESFVAFLVLLHLGTATALLWLYRADWARIVVGLVRAALRGEIRNDDERLAMMLMVGTIPTGALAVFFEKSLKSLFATPRVAAGFLMVNGALLFGAEFLRRRSERAAKLADRPREQQEQEFGDIRRLTFRTAALVGLCQSLALLPGISRSGVTMAAGLLGGLRHEEAARFSFLLATPIIFAAGIVEVPTLFSAAVPLGSYLLAALLSGLAAYGSARFLLRYFESGRMDPYAAYCAVAGAVALVFIR